MERRIYAVSVEITGAKYADIILAARATCPYFLLVARKELGIDKSAEATLSALRPHLVDLSAVKEWPGTTLLDGCADRYLFHLNQSTTALLLSSATGLFDWVQPRLPEDLCFLRESKQPWLVTISHEHDAYFEVSPDEAATLNQQLPWLQLTE